MFPSHILLMTAVTTLLAFSSCTTTSPTRGKNEAFMEWMPWGEFQEYLAEKEQKGQDGKNFWDRGHWILAAEGQWRDGQAQFRIKIGDAPKKPYLWMWYTNLEQNKFDKLIERFTVEGYTMVYCNSYARPTGTILYQAVWHNLNPKKKISANAGGSERADMSADAMPPAIIKTAPPVGATDVDPTTSEITVTFDRDMASGFSWTGGGSNHPPVIDGQRPYWRDTRTAILPVKLEPGRFYRVGINSKSHQNFRGADGVPALPAMIYFTTQGATDDMKSLTRKPVVLETHPANGATGVDPKTVELRITFSLPMGRGFSWTGGEPEFPPPPPGQVPYWTEDQRTCVKPVQLEPNRRYRLGLNSPAHNNFQSAVGVALDPVAYTFQTGP